MSIDNRIVSMQFDNSGFLAKVSETRAALARLSEDLKLSSVGEAAKTITTVFGKVGNAIGSVTMAPLHGAINEVENRFNAFETVVNGIFLRMGSMIADFGVKMVKSLTLDQVTSGFNKYEEILRSTQTILAADEKLTQDDVSAVLDKLTWYTDETSYAMTDMVSNIAKFTSNGIGLEDAADQMMGIGNAAAMSGASVQQATHAMEGFSKAMGSGYMSMQVWNNQIKTSGLGTMAFKEAAIETALAMGKLKKDADGTVKTLNGKYEVSAANFAEGLSKGKWFDKDVMEAVLKKYSKSIDDIYNYYVESGGELTTSEILEQYGKDLDAFSTKAFRLGQEATTFSQAVDSVADALSSKWMKVANLIFGDYEKARRLWTDLANWMYDVAVTPMDSIVDKLSAWSTAIIRWEKDTDTGKKVAVTARDAFIQAMYPIADLVLQVYDIVSDTWKKTMNALDIDKLVSLTEKFEKFTSGVFLIDSETGEFTETAKTLQSILSSIFTTLRYVGDFISRITKIIGKSLSPTIKNIVSLTEDRAKKIQGVFDSITDFMNLMIEKSESLEDRFGSIMQKLAFGFSGLAADLNWENLTGIEKAQQAFSVLGETFSSTILDHAKDLTGLGKNLDESLLTPIQKIYTSGKMILTKVIDSIGKVALRLLGVRDVFNFSIIEPLSILQAYGVVIIDKITEKIGKLSEKLNTIGTWFINSDWLGLGNNTASSLVAALSDMNLVEKLGFIFSLAFTKIGENAKAKFDSITDNILKSVAYKITDFARSITGNFDIFESLSADNPLGDITTALSLIFEVIKTRLTSIKDMLIAVKYGFAFDDIKFEGLTAFEEKLVVVSKKLLNLKDKLIRIKDDIKAAFNNKGTIFNFEVGIVSLWESFKNLITLVKYAINAFKAFFDIKPVGIDKTLNRISEIFATLSLKIYDFTEKLKGSSGWNFINETMRILGNGFERLKKIFSDIFTIISKGSLKIEGVSKFGEDLLGKIKNFDSKIFSKLVEAPVTEINSVFEYFLYLFGTTTDDILSLGDVTDRLREKIKSLKDSAFVTKMFGDAESRAEVLDELVSHIKSSFELIIKLFDIAKTAVETVGEAFTDFGFRFLANLTGIPMNEMNAVIDSLDGFKEKASTLLDWFGKDSSVWETFKTEFDGIFGVLDAARIFFETTVDSITNSALRWVFKIAEGTSEEIEPCIEAVDDLSWKLGTLFQNLRKGSKFWEEFKNTDAVVAIREIVKGLAGIGKDMAESAINGLTDAAIKYIWKIVHGTTAGFDEVLANMGGLSDKLNYIFDNLSFDGSAFWDNFKDLEWVKALESLGNGLYKIASSIVTGIGSSIGKKIITSAQNALSGKQIDFNEMFPDWSKMSGLEKLKAVTEQLFNGGIKAAFGESNLGKYLKWLGERIVKAFQDWKAKFIQELNDGEILGEATGIFGKILKTFLQFFIGDNGKFDWETLFKTRYLVHIFDEILDAWAAFKFKLNLSGTIAAINTYILTLAGSLGTLVAKVNAGSVLAIGIGVALLAASLIKLSEVDGKAAENSSKYISNIASNLLDAMKTMSAINALGNAGGGLGSALVSSKLGFGAGNDGEKAGQGVSKGSSSGLLGLAGILIGMAVVIMIMAKAIVLISQIDDPSKLETAVKKMEIILGIIGAIAVLMVAVYQAIGIFNKGGGGGSSKTFQFFGEYNKSSTFGDAMTGLAKFLITFVAAIAILGAAAYGISKMKDEEIARFATAATVIGLVVGIGLIALLTGIVIFVKQMAKYTENIDTKKLYAMSVIIGAIGASLTLIFSSIAILIGAVAGANLTPTELLFVGGIIGLTMIFLGVLSKQLAESASHEQPLQKGEKANKTYAKIILSIGKSLKKIFRGISWMMAAAATLDATQLGMVTAIVALTFAFMSMYMEQLGKIAKNDGEVKNMKKLGKVFKQIADSIKGILLVIAVVALVAHFIPEDFGTVALVLGIAIAGIAGIIFAFSRIDGSHAKNAYAMVGALMLFTLSMVGIAGALTLLATSADEGNITKAAAILGGIMGAFLLIALIISAIDSKTGGGIALGMIAIAGACLIFSSSIVVLAVGIRMFVDALVYLTVTFNSSKEEILTAMNNLIEMMPKIAELVTAFVVMIISSICGAIAESAITIAESLLNLITTIIEKIAEYAPRIMAALKQLAPYIKTVIIWLINLIFDILSVSLYRFIGLIHEFLVLLRKEIPTLSALLNDVAIAIAKFANTIVSLIAKFIMNTVDTIVFTWEYCRPKLEKLWDSIIDFVLGLVDTLLDEIDEHVSSWAEKVVDIIVDLIDELTKGSTEITESLENFLLTMADNIVDLFKTGGQVIAKLASIPGKVIEGILEEIKKKKDGKGSFLDLGKNIMDGLAEGLSSKIKDLRDKSSGLAKAVLETFMKIFDIHSPSKETAKIGEYVSMGLAKGIGDNQKLAANASERLANSVVDSLNDGIGTRFTNIIKTANDALNSLISDDMNIHPVITPVIDMSDLRNGIKDTNKMFKSANLSVTAGVYSNMKRANQMLSENQNQNGSDSTSVYNFTQNNYSPKSLSRDEIYRRTRNQLNFAKGVSYTW